MDGFQCKAHSATSPLPSLLLLGHPLSDTLAFLPTVLPNLPFVPFPALPALSLQVTPEGDRYGQDAMVGLLLLAFCCLLGLVTFSS